MQRLTRDQTSFYFSADTEPALEVREGEEFLVETQDAHSGTITSEAVVYRSLEEVFERIGGANPVTGPVALLGLAAGECMAVELLEVVGAPVTGFGYMCTTPRLHPDLEPATVICHRHGDTVHIPDARGGIDVPYQPFIGTLGVAPAAGRIESFQQSRAIMGNVDTPEVTTGATVVLRAGVDGGLLALGDAHLVQGDGEIHRSAIETQADVRLRVRRSDPEGFAELPQVNTASFLGSVAPGPGHLEDLVRAAYDDLATRLTRVYGFSLAEAYRLLGAVGEVRVSQVVPPVFAVLAKLPRRYVGEED